MCEDKTLERAIELFIKDFSEKLQCERASLFIGSGISRKAGYSSWKQTLKECAEEIELDVEKEQDLITLAEFYVKTRQRTKINQTITSYFRDNNGSPTSVHEILASFPVKDIWTTNYDTLIERSLSNANISFSIITDDQSYIGIDPMAKVKVHKIHGDVKTPDRCVITRGDYERFELDHNVVLSELKGEMCCNSFLFLGYSFSDIDIQHILSKIRLIYDKSNPQRHYCIVEKVNREDCVDDIDYQYKTKRQDHHIKDMESYGIDTILVNSYDEIEGILQEIRFRIHLHDVFISGAYEESDPLSKLRIAPAAVRLSQKLIENGYNIITGYGKNLGADIVTGAFQGCETAKTFPKNFNDHVFLFPFSYKTTKSSKRDSLYTSIRENMIMRTRISVFISGKQSNSISHGVLEEYRMSHDSGNLIIPLSTTGGEALQIWDLENRAQSFSSKFEEFQKLKTEINPDKMVELTMSMIDKFIKNYQ